MKENIILFEIMIVLLGIIGLDVHSGIFRGRYRSNMFVYYTNLSNLLVLLYFISRLILRYMHIGSGIFYRIIFSETAHFSVMACIMVTFLIYHIVLAPLAKSGQLGGGEFKHDSFGNISVHYIVPMLTFVDWLIVSDKANVKWLDGIYWIVLPIFYTAFAFIKGSTGVNIKYTNSPYPYPFIDPTEIGWTKTVRNVIIIIILFVVLGVLLVAFGKLSLMFRPTY